MKAKLLVTIFLSAVCCLMANARLNPLPIDPDVRIGTLPNGLTYYIRHNSTPEHRADFFLAQRVGSINEEENQRGLAHFLEHMCFNGTKHFPGNTLISYLESIGVKFGANLNAYTSTDETVYNICEVPSTRTSALDSCLLILRDWSHDLTLDGKEIDAERGVIKGEWRQRNGAANNRLLEKAAPVIYSGSLYGHRLPIGLMDVVENFSHDALRDYYRKWYHPQNQCVIVVGDINPDHVEATIKSLWADVNRPDHDATPAPVAIPDNDRVIATVQSDPEQPNPLVQLYIKHDGTPADAEGTIAELRHDLARSLVTAMLVDRFEDIEQDPKAPFYNIGIGDMKFLLSRTKQALLMRANAKPSRETECVARFATELKRAAKHGFLPSELQRAKLDYRAKLDSDFANRNKTPNTTYARKYVRHYLDGGALPSAEQYYKMMKGVINQVDVEQVNDYIRSIVGPDNRNVVLVAYIPENSAYTLAETDMANAYTSIRESELTPYEDRIVAGTLLTEEPKAGSIIAEEDNTLFGSKIWTLSNGIKVHLRYSAHKPDQILIQGYSPGGLSQHYNPELAADYRMANDIIAISAFGDHSSTDLRRMLVGKNIRTSVSIENMEERIGASTTPADLPTALQLLYLKATDIRPDRNAFRALIENKRMKLESGSTNPTFAMGDSIHRHVYSHHPLGEKLKAADLNNVDYERVLNLYRDRFADMSDFTFYVTGDFNEDSLRTYVCRYIASLPAAGRIEQPKDINYRYVTGREHRRFTMPMETPQTIAYTFYNTNCDYNLPNVIKGHILGRLIQSTLMSDLREKRGWTYGVKAHCGLSAGMNGNDPASLIMPVYIRVSPENADSCFSIVASTVDSMSDSGNITADELNKVKSYMVKSYTDNAADNAYWITVMHMYDKFGKDMHNNYEEIVNSISPDDISEFAGQYLTPAHRIQLEMSPDTNRPAQLNH